MFGVQTRLQVTDLPVSALVLLAAASVAVYGFVLAGWSSNSPYSLLGALRSSAQMISYEISMGLSYVAVILYSGSMSTSHIVASQASPLIVAGVNTHIPGWYCLLLLPSFLIFCIAMVGETNRAPFDLPECESELVSGYITEYTGFRYAIYFLAEYINMATVSAVATTLFLGGYHAPWPLTFIPALDSGWMGLFWFFLKVQLLISWFVWLRGTLPRFRYDQFMNLGWKWLIPISLTWLVLVAFIKEARSAAWLHGPVFWAVLGAVALLLVASLLATGREEPAEVPEDDTPFDAFAGGYPVPPMPGQTLPEMAGVVRSTADGPAPGDEHLADTSGVGEKGADA